MFERDITLERLIEKDFEYFRPSQECFSKSKKGLTSCENVLLKSSERNIAVMLTLLHLIATQTATTTMPADVVEKHRHRREISSPVYALAYSFQRQILPHEADNVFLRQHHTVETKLPSSSMKEN